MIITLYFCTNLLFSFLRTSYVVIFLFLLYDIVPTKTNLLYSLDINKEKDTNLNKELNQNTSDKVNLLIEQIKDSFKYGTPEEIVQHLTNMINWNIPIDVPKDIFILTHQELSSLFESTEWTVLNKLLELVRKQNIVTLEQECLELLERKNQQFRLFEQELLYTLIELKSSKAIEPLLKKFYKSNFEIANTNLHLYADFFEKQKNYEYANYVSKKIKDYFNILKESEKSNSRSSKSKKELPDTTISLFVESIGRIKYKPASKILRTLLIYGVDSEWNIDKTKFKNITYLIPNEIELKPSLQLHVIRSLGKVQDLDSSPIIHTITNQYLNAKPEFKKKQFSIYIACIDFLAETKDKRFAPLVLKALRDSSPTVRKYVITTLKNSTSKEVIPYLLYRLEKDPVYTIRLQVLKTLISMLTYHIDNPESSDVDLSIPPLIEITLSKFITNPKKDVPNVILDKISKSLYNPKLFDAILIRINQNIHPKNYISKIEQIAIVRILNNMIKQYNKNEKSIDQQIFHIANKLQNNPFSRYSRKQLGSILGHQKIIENLLKP